MSLKSKVENAVRLGVPPDYIVLNDNEVYESIIQNMINIESLNEAIKYLENLIKNKKVKMSQRDKYICIAMTISELELEEDNYFKESNYEYNQLVDIYESKVDIFDKNLKSMNRILEDIQSFGSSFTNSEITFETAIKKINIRDKRNFLYNLDNAIRFFNEFCCTEEIPYLEYKFQDFEEIKTYRKVFNNKKLLPQLDEYNTRLNVFYFKVILDKVYNCYINIKDSTLEIEYTEDSLNEIKKTISRSFSNIEFYGNEEDIADVGSFETYINDINDFILYSLTLVDGPKNIIKELLFVSDKNSPWMNKTKVNYYYRDVYQRFFGNAKDYNIYFSIEKNGKVTFKSKNGKESINDFTEILSKILKCYQEAEWIREEFSEIINIEYSSIKEYRQRRDSKIQLLRNRFPNIFEPITYVKNCSCKNQPIIIDEEDVEEWKEYNRYPFLFPPSKKGINSLYFVCPHENYKYPSFINNKGKNYEKYPYLPCCQSTNSNLVNSNSYLNYYEKRKVKDVIRKIDYIKKTDINHLSKLQSGALNIEIKKFLKSIFLTDNIARLGASIESNSLLECILLCTEKENEMITREKILKSCRIELTFQETLGISTESIFLNERNYLDAKYFFRLFEEFFEINIIIFSGDEIEIPNNQDIHIRHVDIDRPIIFLYKNTYNNKIIYEIITIDDEKAIMANSKNFKDIIDTSYTVTKDRITYLAPYNHIEWKEILKKGKIISQYLKNGKVCSLNFEYEGDTITIFVPPDAPFNVDISSKIYYSDKKTIERLFGNDYTEKLSALYYSLGEVPEEMFIPLNEECSESNFIYQTQIQQKDLFDFIDVRKKSIIIRQMILWCRQVSDEISEKEWIEKYFIMCDKYIIDVFNIPYQFPEVDNTDDAIKYLSEFCNIFRDGKIYLYGNLLSSLVNYILTTNIPIKIKSIFGLFNSINDFSNIEKNLIFLSNTKYENWFKSKIDNKVKTVISSQDYKDGLIFFEDEYENLFIIQTVKGDNLKRARVLGEIWKKNGKNIELNDREPEKSYRFLKFSENKLKTNNEEGDIEIFVWEENKYSAILPLNF